MSLLHILTGCAESPKRVDAYPFRKSNFAWPYLSICAALATGEALGFASSPANAWWPLVLTMLILWSLIGFGWEIPRWHYGAIFLLGFTLSLYCESCRARIFNQCDYSSSPLAEDFTIDGRVKSTRKYLSFDSRIEGVDVRVMIRKPQADTNGVVTCGSIVLSDIADVPSVGDLWHCSGWLERKARGERRRRTLWVCGRGSSAACVREASPDSLEARLQRLRERLSENIGYGLFHDPQAADLDRAMILGLRADLPRETRQMFADAGTVHVFAISGLHVGVIAWLLVYLLMSVFCFPLRWVALPLAPLLCFYVMMIDAPPSAVRAVTMSVVYFAAPLFFRRSDSLVAWSITFMIFHILNPAMLMNVGSLLSFTVMLGILLYVRWAEVFKREWLLTWGVSIAAWLSGLAIAAHVFERFTFGGLLANLVVIPLASLAVVMGFLGSTTGFIWPWLSSHFNNAAALLIQAMSGISWLVTEIPYANLVVAPWPLWMCFAWYAVLVMIFWLIRSVYIHHRQMF